MSARAIVLLAHGSRDPLWRQPMEAVAARIRLTDPRVLVQCAYLELAQPDLPGCVAGLADAGVARVTIVPMFLGVGKHAREDLPLLASQLEAQYPQIAFQLQAAVGEDPQLITLLANIALGT